MVGIDRRSLRERIFGESRREREARERQLEREQFNQMLQQERDAQRELLKVNASAQAEMLKAMASSSNVFAEYLKLVTSHGKPQVRIMTDEIEARLEKEREAAAEKAREAGTMSLRDLAGTLAAGPDRNHVNPMIIAEDLESFKKEMGL